MIVPKVIEELILDYAASMEEYERRKNLNYEFTHDVMLSEIRFLHAAASHGNGFCLFFCFQIMKEYINV